jgi:hypothetical protein
VVDDNHDSDDDDDDSTYASIPSQARQQQPLPPATDDIYGDPDQGVELPSDLSDGDVAPHLQLYGDQPPLAVAAPSSGSTKVARSISLPPEPFVVDMDPVTRMRRAASTRPLPAVPGGGQPPPATMAHNNFSEADEDEDIDLYGSTSSTSHLYGVTEEDDEEDTHIPTLSRDRETFRRPTYVRQEPSPLDLSNDPRQWGISDVLRWLKEFGFDDFKEKVYANGFVGPQLLGLRATDFRAHGFSSRRCADFAAGLADLNERVRMIERRASSVQALAGQLLTSVTEADNEDELYGQPNSRPVPVQVDTEMVVAPVIDDQEEYTALPPAPLQLHAEDEEYSVLPPPSQPILSGADDEYTALPPSVPPKPKPRPKPKAKPFKPPKPAKPAKPSLPTPPPKPSKPGRSTDPTVELLVRPQRSVSAMNPPTYATPTAAITERARPASLGVNLGLYELPEAAKLKAKEARALPSLAQDQDDVYGVPSGLPVPQPTLEAPQQAYGSTFTDDHVYGDFSDEPTIPDESATPEQLYGDAPGLGGLEGGPIPIPQATMASSDHTAASAPVYDDRVPEYGQSYDDLQPTYAAAAVDYGQPLLQPARRSSVDTQGYSAIGGLDTLSSRPPSFSSHEYAYPTLPSQGDPTYAEPRDSFGGPPRVPSRPVTSIAQGEAAEYALQAQITGEQHIYGEGATAILVPRDVADYGDPDDDDDDDDYPVVLDTYATVPPANERRSLAWDNADAGNMYEIDGFEPETVESVYEIEAFTPPQATRPVMPARPTAEALYGASFVSPTPMATEEMEETGEETEEMEGFLDEAELEEEQTRVSEVGFANKVAHAADTHRLVPPDMLSLVDSAVPRPDLVTTPETTEFATVGLLVEPEPDTLMNTVELDATAVLLSGEPTQVELDDVLGDQLHSSSLPAASQSPAEQSPSRPATGGVPISSNGSYENLRGQQQVGVSFDDSDDEDAADVVYLEDMAEYVNVDTICQHYGLVAGLAPDAINEEVPLAETASPDPGMETRRRITADEAAQLALEADQVAVGNLVDPGYEPLF